jgi:hypothetical protein
MLPSVLASLTLLLAASGSLPSQDAQRDAGWRGDLEILVAQARREHADPARPAWSKDFAQAAQELHTRIRELSDDGVMAGLMRLVAILNDGHTAVYGARPDSPCVFEQRVLPLRFRLFPGGLYVIGGEGELVEHAGSRVLHFSGVPAEDVLERMSVFRGGDNEVTWRWLGPQFYVGRLALLREVGVADEDGRVVLALRTPEGSEREIELTCGEFEHPRKLRPFPLGDESPPRWLADVDTPARLEPLEEHDAVYVQFNNVRDSADETLAAFAGRLRAALLEQSASTLIIDVRHNNGGNNTLLRPLLRTMIEFEMRDPGHRIFVLMGRNTFSAAQNFLNRTERWTDATFVGEPSSSSPNFTGEDNEFELPYSRVFGSLSNLYWQDSLPWDDRPWIEPDLPVELSVWDWIAGEDPVLDRVLEEL